jgi:isoleucyl-tRNA synthetase
MDYKDTLNLPKTDFPMKANLVAKEPELLKQWEAMDVYAKIRQARAGHPKYVFHDGPPYANGHIHIGHALNKILKDFIVKIKVMKGYDALFVPGWDCHGLPIEHQVVKDLKEKKRDASRTEIRRLCREYAQKFFEIQREEFKRLGVFADWDRPYLTMNPGYQATIVREFLKFVENGMAYKGSKPVHWCTSCITALAEAEVEYSDTASPSIYVKFAVRSGVEGKLAGVAPGAKAFFVIWTTTPWTLPANLAVCLNPEFQYVVVRIAGEDLIVAEDRLSALLMEWGVSDHKILGRCSGKDLDRAVARHPFIERDALVILGDHVTLEQGTGCVHTAPGHGQEDYIVGQKYGLETYTPVDDHGIFKPEVEHFGGMFVRKANPAIVQLLKDRGALVHEGRIEHSFPHCWRCRQPIIFRATPQWFISMDRQGLRAKALDEINKTQWVPSWGRERIYGMVENRPDWCVSRQRSWGVPIAVFLCRDCKNPLVSQKVFERVVALVEKEGADFWFERTAEEILPPGTACSCGGKQFDKENDILDVWFDSGVSHAAVLERDPALHWPADMYLEGSDQHRGWFHSSLLEAVATRGKAPYKTVLTHGYVVDGKGRKMSKSLGNVIAPEEIMRKYGAEILRLWVASENYREDIRISDEILVRLTEAYRKIRNTFRFLLGNLDDFDPGKDAVPLKDLLEIDRYILQRLKQLCTKMVGAFENYEFHVFYQAFYSFCVVDLSSFYLDILKDRLYTYPKRSVERRSGQTALHILLLNMTRLMAPILSFLAEEIWAYLPKVSAKEASVFLSAFPDMGSFPDDDAALALKWGRIIELRGEVSKALEICRKDKIIGHSLDAQVTLVLPQDLRQILAKDLDELKYIFIVSQVVVCHAPDADAKSYSSDLLPGVQVSVQPMPGKKCERCWNYFSEIEETSVCARCFEHLEAAKASP